MLESELPHDEEFQDHLAFDDDLGPAADELAGRRHLQDEQESKGREDREKAVKRKAPDTDAASIEALKRRIVHLEIELEKKDDLVEQLSNALETTKEEKQEKEIELDQVTQNLLPLAESLHKMQQQLDERDALQADERENVEAHFADLVQQLEAARAAIESKEREIEVLHQENEQLKKQISKRGSQKYSFANGSGTEESDVDLSDKEGSGFLPTRARLEEDATTEEEPEETIGEAAGPPDEERSLLKEDVKPPALESIDEKVEEEKPLDPFDSFREEMEREYKKINDSLQSAEQFSLMFSKKTQELTSNIYRIKEVRELEKDRSKLEESLANGGEEGASADDGFEQKVKAWPREMLEKQLKHYRDAFNAERKSMEELEEEKYKVEEELMSTKLELEQKQLEVATLQSGKEQLEQYVAQLAEEMENETSQMISMKEQFQTETMKFTEPDFSTYLESDSEGYSTGEEDGDGKSGGQGSSALASPAMSPIAPRVRAGEDAGVNNHHRDVTKRRSLNLHLDLNAHRATLAAVKGRPHSSRTRSTGPSAASSGSHALPQSGRGSMSTSFRSEDEDTATEGMYSEDEGRESTEGEEIIGKYREEVSQLREELRTVREELQRANEERDRQSSEVRAHHPYSHSSLLPASSSSSSSSVTTSYVVHHHRYVNDAEPRPEISLKKLRHFDYGGGLVLTESDSEEEEDDEVEEEERRRAKALLAKRRRAAKKERQESRHKRRRRRVKSAQEVAVEAPAAEPLSSVAPGEGHHVPDEPAPTETATAEGEKTSSSGPAPASQTLSHALTQAAFSLFSKFKRTI